MSCIVSSIACLVNVLGFYGSKRLMGGYSIGVFLFCFVRVLFILGWWFYVEGCWVWCGGI